MINNWFGFFSYQWRWKLFIPLRNPNANILPFFYLRKFQQHFSHLFALDLKKSPSEAI